MRLWKRPDSFDVEAELRKHRPEPRPELLQAVSARVRGAERPVRRSARLALAGALMAALLLPLAAFGGFGYAATGAKSTWKALGGDGTAKRVTAAQNQYAGEKCLVQHRTGSGTFRTIFVNPHAVPAHRAHGDTVIICPAP